MKKTIAAVLAAATLVTGNVYAVGFKDTIGHWAESAINTLADRGIVDGVTDTEFVPDGEVTRAQYLKMIMEATGIGTTDFREGECLELTARDWYAPYLQKALDCGLIPEQMITGYKAHVEYEVDEDGNATSSKVIYSGAFNGGLPITREEMAVLTQYCYQYSRTVLTTSKVDINKVKGFNDEASISEWAESSVKLAVANGFIEGMDNSIFSPKTSTTRAQAATVILRVLNK